MPHADAAESRASVNLGGSRVVGSAIKDWRILQAIEYLDTSNFVSLSSIAKHLNLSLSRFRHLFSGEVGISPVRYSRLQRLARARELLRSSSLRVKEIAGVLGFNDVSHFVRNYKLRFRETPSQTRTRSQLRSSSSRPIARLANK